MKNRVIVAIALCASLSSQCMEHKQKNNIKSLKALAGEVVCKNGLFHKIQVSELKHQVQLTRELSEIGDLCSFDADYEKLLSLITGYSDIEKLKHFYFVECFGDSYERIVKTCADFYYELLSIYLLNGHLLIHTPRNEHDVLMKAAVFGDENDITNAIAFVETDNLKKIINEQYAAFGALPLVEASRRGLLGNVAQLLELGADVNAHDGYGKTALIMAALNGHIELVKMLLAHGAYLTAEDNKKLTALTGAILKGHTKVVEYLLEYDSGSSESVGLVIKSFYDPLVLAVRSMDPELLELVFNNISPSQSSINEMVIIAAEAGNTYAVKLLLSKDAEVNSLSGGQKLPLLVACGHGNTEIVQLLLDQDADINKADTHGTTALMSAARWGHKNVVELLIERGAPVNPANNVGTTAVMHAAIGGYAEIIELLVNFGASLDFRGIDDNTALTLACFFGRNEAIALLLKSGADVNCVNKDGETALMIAAREGYKEIIDLLLAYKAHVNALSKKSMTALLYASENFRDDCIEPLLKMGAEINATDNDGNTILLVYAMRGSEEMVKMLLDYGADISCVNKRGETVAMQNAPGAILELIHAKKNE